MTTFLETATKILALLGLDPGHGQEGHLQTDHAAEEQLRGDSHAEILQRLGITQIREERVLEFTRRQIAAIDQSQRTHLEVAGQFAARVLQRLHEGGVIESDSDFLMWSCNRFLAGVGSTLRREIPHTVSRSERRNIRRLVIDWQQNVPYASWLGVDVIFPLRQLLMFCAEHSAGAEGADANAMADQLLHELRGGIAVIPRLTIDYRDASRVILNWESRTAPLSVGSVESRATEDRRENFRKAMEGVLIDCSRVIEQELGNYEHVETKRIAASDHINRSFPEGSFAPSGALADEAGVRELFADILANVRPLNVMDREWSARFLYRIQTICRRGLESAHLSNKDASIVSQRAMALRVIENALRETDGPTESSAT